MKYIKTDPCIHPPEICAREC